MHRALSTGAAVAIFAVVLASSVFGRGGIGDARDFRAFDVYFAGHRVLGLRLAEVNVFGDGRDAEVVAFYGKCKTVPGGGCSYELEVGNTSMCRTYPEIYFSPPPLEPINGARGGWVRTAHLYDVYTGPTAVTILGVSRKEARRVGKDLRNLRRSERTEELPRSRRRLLEGKARCQRGPIQPPG